jgi:hypothetical protein
MINIRRGKKWGAYATWRGLPVGADDNSRELAGCGQLVRRNLEAHAKHEGAGMLAAASMRPAQRFSADILPKVREGEGLRIRAGTRSHRFIGI